jgi:hypothetical protein
VWVHFTVLDAQKNVLFDSGNRRADGSIVGRDHDLNPNLIEPHYDGVASRDQVQVYESILLDSDWEVTTTR